MKRLFIISALVVICNFSIYAQCSNPNAGADDAICGNQYNLIVHNATTGYWQAFNNGELLNPQPEFLPNNTATDLTVTVAGYGIIDFVWFDNSGPCNDTVKIEFVETPVISAGEDLDVCGLCATLEGVSGGFSGYWSSTTGATFEDSTDPNSGVCVNIYISHTFIWQETNSATTTSLSCSAQDEAVVTFWRAPTANILTDAADSTECGLTFELLRAELPGSGISGIWYSTNPAIIFGDETSHHTWATAPDYGYYDFYWIESRGPASNPDFCRDTAGPLIIHFLEMPEANAGDDVYFCGLEGQLHAVPSVGTGTWSSPSVSNLSLEGINDPNTIISSSILNYPGSTLPYFTLFWTESNSVCTDRDTVRAYFFDFDFASGSDFISHVYPMVVDDNPVTLTAWTSGGIWSGNGITNPVTGVFDPSVAGIGLHTISYSLEVNGCSGKAQTVIQVTGMNIYGYVYRDINSNCICDIGEGIPNILIYANPGPLYFITDENGRYRAYLDEGAYTIHPVLPENYTASCPGTGFQNVIISDVTDTLQNINLGLTENLNCPVLNCQIATTQLRPCSLSSVFVECSNTGTGIAENPNVEVELDPDLIYEESFPDYSSVSGNIYTFNLDPLDVFESVFIVIQAYTDCDTDLLGQTSCVTATIFPNTPCGTDFGDWDHSDIAVTGDCIENLNACFTITNNAGLGVGDMGNAQDYRIFANDTLVFTGTFQLLGGASTEICWATNGSAIRLEADQHPEHPYSDYSVHTIEACGDNNGTSYGYITTNTYDDEEHFVDTYCREITSSCDPNAKEVYPSGITENNYIGDDITLTYQINFQNTGTDTAFTVVIVDTVSNLHNMMTFERGVSSHPCELEIYDSGIMVWTFNNILLPDSTTNEVESHGFVTYKINPVEMDQSDYGTQIFNNAAIFFDYNPPVITNTTRLTYWKLPILLNGIKPVLPLNYSLSIFPNPSTNMFSIKAEKYPAEVSIWDLNGRLVKSIEDYSGEELSVGGMSKGMYFVKLKNEDGVSFGKLVVE